MRGRYAHRNTHIHMTKPFLTPWTYFSTSRKCCKKHCNGCHFIFCHCHRNSSRILRTDCNSRSSFSVLLSLIQHLGMKAVTVHIFTHFIKSYWVFLSFDPLLGFDSAFMYWPRIVWCHDKTGSFSHLDHSDDVTSPQSWDTQKIRSHVYTSTHGR